MDIIEQIERGESYIKVGTLTANYRIEFDSEDAVELLRLAKIGQQMQRVNEHCPMDYEIMLDCCPSDRECANCWLRVLKSLPPKEDK